MRRYHPALGVSLTSEPQGGGGGAAAAAAARHQGRFEAASRPPSVPRRAASADGRAAASTDAQIGSVAPGREAAAMDDAAATLADSAAHSEDSQAGSGGLAGSGFTPAGPHTADQSGGAPSGRRPNLCL